MVSRMPTIRPIRFSALKALNPLQDEEEHGEDDDRQPYVQQVRHGSPPSGVILIQDSVNVADQAKDRAHAEPMRRRSAA